MRSYSLPFLSAAALVVAAALISSPIVHAQTSTSASSAASTIDPKNTGNCVSGRYYFNKGRTYFVGTSESLSSLNVDTSAYDWTCDYGKSNAKFLAESGNTSVQMVVTAPASGSQGDGTRLSTSRYILYGKVTAVFTASGVPGAVTAFITMSDVKDEIDFETVGKDVTTVQSNVFAKGIAEFGKHGGTHSISGNINQKHTYTLDWTHDSIKWIVDGTTVRTLLKSDSYQTTANGETFNNYWFPMTPSQVQLSVWDGGNSASSGTSDWAGGPTDLTKNITGTFDYVEIQCYDDNDKAVSAWPVGSDAVVTHSSSSTTTTTTSKASSRTTSSVSATNFDAVVGPGGSSKTSTSGSSSTGSAQGSSKSSGENTGLRHWGASTWVIGALTTVMVLMMTAV